MPDRGAFFPDPVFGWVFYLALVGVALLPAYRDWKEFKIPKAVPIVALGLGLVLNLVRGAWLGTQGEPVWVLPADGFWTGLADGLLFASAGFGVGFGLFFGLWVFGLYFIKTVGGGDVKLFGAIGAWVGPRYAIYLLIGTYLMMLMVVIGMFTKALFSGGFRHARSKKVAYSLPIALSVMVIMLWVCRHDLLPQSAGLGSASTVTKTNGN
jgi:prepilin peptidase CpaA